MAKGFFGADWDAGYSLTPRAANHFWIHRPDVPADVIAADEREAAQVACPVFVAFGDHDVPEHPHDDVSFYGASDDVTLMVLADSAHCHNFAGTRNQLWDRLADWAGSFSRGGRARR